MLLIRDTDRPFEEWRSGVRTRMYAAASVGSTQLVVFEQWCDPGHGAPQHRHSVEEVLRVLVGEAHVSVGGEQAILLPGESVIIPPGAAHGFYNSGGELLQTQAILASPVFEAQYLETEASSYRWVQGSSS